MSANLETKLKAAEYAAKVNYDGWQQEMARSAAENDRLRAALAAIQKATLEGRVCDDVAWFDSITTLHDFCDIVLNGPDE